ncbi:synaptic vesicle glycoprotein 2A isoform X3 [Mirounga angustirostris]|uniref:synaptic vesicle glycoprotein 2A isoform X3 n=1 Tax=Mirounga angustirostris TaxID=9716 RepID=UPI0023E3C3F1|nr:synaptic vesicle glycoprotein 2A isoform X1 [Mirounga angustirostris]
MEEGFRDRAAFIRGAKDIAKEVKKHAAKKVVKGLDRVQDEYSRRSYSRFEEEEDDDDFPAPADGYYRGEGAQDEEEGGASSDATEGHDEDDEIYEGEYQGIPRAESGGKGERMADGAPLAGGRGGLGNGEGPPGGRGEAQRRKEREELAQQYEAILRECGHGRFQWTLYFVLGLALMADGVEVFVVGFVLPSAEKDMCLSDSNKGMLGWSFQMGSAYQFHSWRVFVLVCAFPSVFAIGALTTQPESPRFFLENGKHDEAWMVLKQVHDTNMRAKGHPERVFSVTHIKTIHQEDELIEIQSDTGTWYQRWGVRALSLGGQVWGNFLSCFGPEYRRITLMMMGVWFTMSFSYYGLTVWFPDMIRHLQAVDYEARTKLFSGEHVEHVTFNFTLENQIHRGGQYFNDKFIGLRLKSVSFEDSLFEECYFEDVTSSNTFFRNCTFINTVFYNTDLFEYKFVNSRLVNSTFLHNKEGCPLDVTGTGEGAYMVYFVSFLGTLAVLPGNIVSALLMDKIGRLRMLAGSSVMSCVSCFFLSFGNSESAMIALLCLFGGVSIASWNALDVLTVELYPSDKRTTAFGFLNALCKLAAVLGISIFTSFVGITKAAPILFASAALALGSSLALKLPETRGQVLQ